MSSFRSSRGASTGVLAVTLLLALSGPRSTSAQGTESSFAPGTRTIVDLDFAGTPVGRFPKDLTPHGPVNLEVVVKDGRHMLRASSPSEFVIHVPEVLPKNFTVEFELIPKSCCQPEDLMFEGVISGSRSSVSAQLTWHPKGLMVVGGNSQLFQMDMPDAVAAALPSALATIAVSFEDETVTMYTNGKRLYTLTDRKFVRGRVLKVSLGGQDEDKYAVYLAKLRVADLAPSIVAQAAPVNAVLVQPTTTGTITPTPTSTTTLPTPIATSPTKPTSPTVMSNAAPPTDLTAQGSPVSVYLTWTSVQGAVRFEISRAVQGTTSWTALGTPPNYADALYFRDYFPSYTATYTYQVSAFQPDGSYGSAAVDFTPPTPTDPANFTAKQTGPGQVEFEWDFVTGATKYFLAGPGTGNGIVVFAGAHSPGATNHHTLSGIPAGTHSWTIATDWEPGGILTLSTAWPKATATITAANPGPRYRLVALGFKAIAQSKDVDDARDGHGDEVYFSAIVNRARLTGIPLPVTKGANVSTVMTRSHGDEAVSVPYGRIKAGTASVTGGIQSGDAVPANFDPAAPTAALQQLTFPLLVWEGELPDSDVVVVHPVLWEDDVNPVVQAMWAKALFDAAASGYVNMPPQYDGYISSGTIPHRTAERIYGFNQASLSPTAGIRTISNGLEPDMRRNSVPGNPLFRCTVGAFNLTRRPCEAHGVDRPLGLEMGSGGGFATDWLDRVIVLTRTTVEAALTGSPYAPYGVWPRGTFSLKLLDQVALEPLDIEAIAKYELFFRIERVP